MQHSKITSILFAACAFASTQIASAALVTHPYNCRLIQGAPPYQEIPGAFWGGAFTNNSGSTAIAICPLTCENTANDIVLYASEGVSSCALGISVLGNTNYFPRSGNGYFEWLNAGDRCSNSGLASFEIQCSVPQGDAIYLYHSYVR